MRTLIYKRTHNGDPDPGGRFGYYDCMGRIRNLDFQAVIGIGGIGSEAAKSGIEGAVNWIGIRPKKSDFTELRGPLVRFDHFVMFGNDAPDFREMAPVLADRMLRRYGPRYLFDSFDELEREEIETILQMARRAQPSRGKAVHGLHVGRRCKPHC